MDKVIEVKEEAIQEHLNGMVRDTVENMLNAMLEKEADVLCNAQRYEHTDARVDTRAGHYNRIYTTRVGDIKLEVPKLRKLPFESAVIEHYKRREISIEEALIEMYLAGDFRPPYRGHHGGALGCPRFCRNHQ